MSPRKLCVLGAGNMGRALIGGLLRAGERPEQLSVGEPRPAARESLARELGVSASPDNAVAVAGASVVVLAVKPQEAAAVLRPLAAALSASRPLLISVLAGTRVRDLESWCAAELPVVRAMPNRPALLGAGITGMYAPLKVAAAERRTAEAVLRCVGEVVWVPTEDTLDVITALSGSGPAYFFLLAECMAEAGQQLGLEHSVAQRLAVATLHGSGLLAHADGAELARLRAEVTSAGGTTEAALRVLEQGGLKGLVARALGAAAQRGRELATPPKSALPVRENP
jgi:pyrroline-5-carboxylate reductase